MAEDHHHVHLRRGTGGAGSGRPQGPLPIQSRHRGHGNPGHPTAETSTDRSNLRGLPRCIPGNAPRPREGLWADAGPGRRVSGLHPVSQLAARPDAHRGLRGLEKGSRARGSRKPSQRCCAKPKAARAFLLASGGGLGGHPEAGVWHLDIGTAGGRSIKTASSRRKIPLHPKLEWIDLPQRRRCRRTRVRIRLSNSPFPIQRQSQA